MPITLDGTGSITGLTATGISAVQNLPATGTITNLTTTTISNGAVSTSSENVIRGSARAWVLFNASTGVVASSYNVSSITSSGTGGIVNMTNAMPDTNYLVVSGTTDDSAFNNASNVQGTTSNRTVTSFTMACWNRTGPGVGPSGLSVVVFR